MNRRLVAFVTGFIALGACSGIFASQSREQARPRVRRVVIFKIDGLNADLLYRTMRQKDPMTGRSRLPWFSNIFAENGMIFENFYTRGISLSSPSWSMLTTGRHVIIRGNVEYDRFTGHVYDYLNFFPFYMGYARSRNVDMPAVEVLDRAGIPLVSDAFSYAQKFQSFQLFQRGVRWSTLQHVLVQRFSTKVILPMLESAGTPSLDELLGEQTEKELKQSLENPEIFYLDFYTGDMDDQSHATNNPAALLDHLRRLDALAGRMWTKIQATPLAPETLFVVVSDHGMNNVPGIFSESFSLPDVFNSRDGGAHHVITNRHQLSDYKLMGLNPLVQRVTTPSTVSFYLKGEEAHYPTAWLDLDGNERAAVHLRNSDLNKIHILLLELARSDLQQPIRKAAAECLQETIERHRAGWEKTIASLDEEMRALAQAIEQRQQVVRRLPKTWTADQKDHGEDKRARRLAKELNDWKREHGEYTGYLRQLRALLAFQPDSKRAFRQKIADFVPERTLGDNNTVADLEHYVAGPTAEGLVLDESGRLDEERSFRFVDYFSLLSEQRARNNPQPALSSRPIDFIAMCLPDEVYDPAVDSPQHAYWLYGDESSQILILVDRMGRIAVKPIGHLTHDKTRSEKLDWSAERWHPGLPLQLFEDTQLKVPPGVSRAAWLSEWHSEQEWLEAVHMCKYSNAVIGIGEELSPVADNVPGPPGISTLMLRYERHRRELVQADFHVFAADHWNFNVRSFNPGGNHGGFFRISTHSVWMMAGAGLPTQVRNEPYDSLNFASSVLALLGYTPPMPDRAVLH
ncbi:MAG: alkaline phosphatase family protein [Bryobacteraceae bacterium]